MTDATPKLVELHDAANTLHHSLATSLQVAGVNASTDDPAEVLIAKAKAAGQASPTVAPNSADIALASFNIGLTAAMLRFAQAHLPARYQPLAEKVIETGVPLVEELAEAAIASKAAR